MGDGGAMREKYYYTTAQDIVDGVVWYKLTVTKQEINDWIKTQDTSMWDSLASNEWWSHYHIHCELLTAIKLKYTE